VELILTTAASLICPTWRTSPNIGLMEYKVLVMNSG
jgi:hypothetical protein